MKNTTMNAQGYPVANQEPKKESVSELLVRLQRTEKAKRAASEEKYAQKASKATATEMVAVQAAPAKANTKVNATADAKQKTNMFKFDQKWVKFGIAAFASIILVSVVAIMAGIIKDNKILAEQAAQAEANAVIYKQVAAMWDAKYQNAEEQLYGVYDFDGEYVCVLGTDMYEALLTNEPVPEEPEWVKTGLQEAIDANCTTSEYTEKALFACKYFTIKEASEYSEEIRALGIGVFEHPEEYSEEQMERVMPSFVWHMKHLI